MTKDSKYKAVSQPSRPCDADYFLFSSSRIIGDPWPNSNCVERLYIRCSPILVALRRGLPRSRLPHVDFLGNLLPSYSLDISNQRRKDPRRSFSEPNMRSRERFLVKLQPCRNPWSFYASKVRMSLNYLFSIGRYSLDPLFYTQYSPWPQPPNHLSSPQVPKLPAALPLGATSLVLGQGIPVY